VQGKIVFFLLNKLLFSMIVFCLSSPGFDLIKGLFLIQILSLSLALYTAATRICELASRRLIKLSCQARRPSACHRVPFSDRK